MSDTNETEAFLAHYGKKGMKWGRRKAGTTSGGSARKSSERGQTVKDALFYGGKTAGKLKKLRADDAAAAKTGVTQNTEGTYRKKYKTATAIKTAVVLGVVYGPSAVRGAQKLGDYTLRAAGSAALKRQGYGVAENLIKSIGAETSMRLVKNAAGVWG